MKKLIFSTIILAQTCLSAAAFAQEESPPAPLTVTVGGITDGQSIPQKFAYCVPDGKGQYAKTGGDISPAISWSGAPPTTKSYAIILLDKDVPASFEKANKPGETIPVDFPRQNFFHWVLVDIPPSITSLPEGKESMGILPNGKPLGKKEYGVSGQNNFTLLGQSESGGYDGPCPPWNDERIHHYHFMVYALDIPTLGVVANLDGKKALAAMDGHILAQGEVVGSYTDNAALLPK